MLLLWLMLEEAQGKRSSCVIMRQEGRSLSHRAVIRHCDGVWKESDSQVRVEQRAQAQRNCSSLLAQVSTKFRAAFVRARETEREKLQTFTVGAR